MNDEDIIDLFFDRKESAIFETDNKYGNHLSKLAMIYFIKTSPIPVLYHTISFTINNVSNFLFVAKMILILRLGTPFRPLAQLIFLPI